MKNEESQHIMNLILLIITVVTVGFFYESLQSSQFGILFLVLFVFAGAVFTSILNVGIILQRYGKESKLLIMDKIDSFQSLMFFTISILFWEFFVQVLLGLNETKDLLKTDSNNVVEILLIFLYPIAFFLLILKARSVQKEVKGFIVKVSPSEFIQIRGTIGKTQLLFVNIRNDSNKKFEDVIVSIHFPEGVHFWVDSMNSDSRFKVFIRSLELDKLETKEIKIIPVYIGTEPRSGGLIDIQIKNKTEFIERTIRADLRDPSENIQEAKSNEEFDDSEDE